tara:strand:- start:593 stop:2659 length:2067 start_codon:yes stop_codon:yes gene_type:complete
MSSINSRVPPLRLAAVDSPSDGEVAAYQASSGQFEWVSNSGGGGGSGTVTSVGLSETGTALTITGSPVTTSGTINIAGAGTSSQVILGDLSLGTLTSGTVTSVGTSQAFITITNPTTTPSISIGNASATATGVLTATDWTTFNNKQDALTLTTTGSSGAATLVGSTLNIPQYSGGGGGSGTVTSITPAADSGTGTAITTSGTFTYTGGTGVTTSVSGTTVTINADNNGTVDGTGALQQVAVWSDADTIGGSTNLTFTGTALYTPTLRTGGSVTTLGATDLTIDTNEGTNTGSIVIEDGVNGQISINPNGLGTIKLDGVELDNSAISTGYVLKATSATAAGWAAESGGVTFPLEGSDGAVGAPTYSFSSQSTTGMYYPASSQIGFSIDGNERMTIKNNAVEGITFRVDGTDTAASPGFSFDPDNDTGIFSVVNNTLSFSTGASERLRIGTSGEILIGGTAAGTSGQVLTSGGASAAPTWETPSGGGSGLSATEGIPQVGLPTTGSNLLQFPLVPIYNNTSTSGNGVVSATNTVGTLIQFFGHQTGTIQSLTCETFGSSNKMQLAVYSADSNNLPSTRVGDSAEWDVEADGIHTVDLSGLSSTISITKGDMYYLGLVIKEGTARPTLRIFSTSEGYSFNLPSNSLTTETMSVFNRTLEITGLTASTWPSSLTTANLTGVTNFVPNIGVVY